MNPFSNRSAFTSLRRDKGGRRMKIFWTLTRRELAAFFCSITGYVDHRGGNVFDRCELYAVNDKASATTHRRCR